MKNKDLNKTLSKLEWCAKDNEKGAYDGVGYVLSPGEVNQLYNYIKLLERENKAIADDNEMKCELNEELAKENKQLLERIKRLEARL